MPGPKKTARHLKLMRGTLQPCRDSAPAAPGLPAIDSATPPSWLQDVVAVAEFRRLASVLTVNGLLTVGNTALLAHLAMLHARITATWLSGESPSAASLMVYRRLCGDLGLTSLPTPASTGRPNRFAEIARRRR